MDCRDIQDQFSEYYDDDPQSSSVHIHLENCDKCAAEYEKYAQLIDQVRTLPNPEMPQGFHRKLMAYVLNAIEISTPPMFERSAPVNRRKFKVVRAASYATLAASIILAILVAGDVFDRQRDDTIMPVPLGIQQYYGQADYVEWTDEVPFAPAMDGLSRGERIDFEEPSADAWGDMPADRMTGFNEDFEFFGIDIFALDSEVEVAGGGGELPVAIAAPFDATIMLVIDEPIAQEPQRRSLTLLIFVIGVMIVGSIGAIAVTTAKLNKE